VVGRGLPDARVVSSARCTLRPCANLSVYDAAYDALAEALDVPLVTADPRLARAPGTTCQIEVLGG
jgi:predicted nucleic acid-binding protein